ncbi:hypothetical protein [Phyllobacterium sp. YR531]|uniref:hypothetical protein n=1 Tax=Phyllobacterium sp. YR531 TaxID=1144343 RepID=UPI00026FBADC|nr:hypothetical protein [Phyllobacterium sp. YR531]EJN04256.1 hypothetical protein PMI41_01895 [Phyllobacterium sp. YR531]
MFKHLHGSNELPREAAEFFIVFSRYEFALKRAGFVNGTVGKAASPNWDGYGKKLGTTFFGIVTASEQAKIFFEKPPKRLDLQEDRTLKFLEVEAVTNNKKLFDAVKRVRNNLFHGEKISMGERDKKLIAASLHVLELAMDNPGISEECKRVVQTFQYSPSSGQ